MEEDNIKTANDIMADMTRQCKSTQAEKMAQINANIAEINASTEKIEAMQLEKQNLLEKKAQIEKEKEDEIQGLTKKIEQMTTTF